VVAAAGVGEQRIRVLPARLVVYYNLAMIVFFQSSYGQVWTKLVGGDLVGSQRTVTFA
jgi:hypothetical protein